MKPAIARSIVFNSFDLAMAGRIAAVKSDDPFLCWVYLNKKIAERSNKGRIVMFDMLRTRQDLCKVKKMVVKRNLDPKHISLFIYETLPGFSFRTDFYEESGEVVCHFKKSELEDLTDLQCIRIAYALTFLYVHETKSVFDGQANRVREMFGVRSIL